jgi:hypothetical protein
MCDIVINAASTNAITPSKKHQGGLTSKVFLDFSRRGYVFLVTAA